MPVCCVVFAHGVDVCPQCKPIESKLATDPIMKNASPEENESSSALKPVSEKSDSEGELSRQTRSTLIAFPGSTRSSKPQWRQELSARVREIQERKAREGNDTQPPQVEFAAETPSGIKLGVVAPSEAPDVNPIVVAALKRLERARQGSAQPARGVPGRTGATATARLAREEEVELEAPIMTPAASVETVEDPAAPPIKERKLVVVPAAQTATPPEISEDVTKPQPRKVIEGVVDDAYLARLEKGLLPPVAAYEPLENFAPLGRRVCAAIADLFVVGFAVTPFAAIIELRNGNWGDPRVEVTMGGIVVLAMLLYQTASIGLSGRTFGMAIFSLRAVDSRSGVHPSTLQSIARAISYVLVIATGFLGILTALFDGERRTIHDMLSRTVLVSEG
jgi:uncharacterized RDD family membrane protein YckC